MNELKIDNNFYNILLEAMRELDQKLQYNKAWIGSKLMINKKKNRRKMKKNTHGKII